MGFWIFMCVTVLLIPFLMISFGGLFSRSAPKEINSAFGYRTSMSMKMQIPGSLPITILGKSGVPLAGF